MSTAKLISQFTLTEVIERKIQFIKEDSTSERDSNYDEGQLVAYKEMLENMRVMTEKTFVDKFLSLVHNMQVNFENNVYRDCGEIARMSGYNNAIVSILVCINPMYEFINLV